MCRRFAPSCSCRKAAVGGADVFPSIAEKAAILGHLILKLRPFTDANAETARSAMYQFLKQNGALSDQSASRQAGSFTDDRHDVSYQAVLMWLQLHLDRPQQVPIDEPEP